MPFSKLPKVIQDFGLGFQSVNTTQNNEQYVHDTFDAEHWTGKFTKLHVTGGHNVVTIARSVGAVKVSSFSPVTGTTQLYYWFEILSTHGYIKSAALIRYAPGFYFITVGHTDGEVCWCEATPEGDASNTRFISTRYSVQSGGAPVTSIFLRCFELSSGSFALADYNFSFALFSR